VSRFHLLLWLRIVHHGDGYAVSAEAAADFVVYSCVAVSLACVSDTGYFPVPVVCPYDLGVTRDDVEGRFCLGSVELNDKVQQAFP